MSRHDHTMNDLVVFPKDPRENLAWRRRILLRCKKDLVYRAKVKELFHRDILFGFNAFFFTLDPRKRPLHNQPFCTYPYQDEAILRLKDHINKGEDLPLEKSRDMGASWMILSVFLWFWLDPVGGADFLMGSRIEDYVDKKGDPRSLFAKLRYALYKLPTWLRPKKFSPKKHDNFMRLQNPETLAAITGESNNANFSTGGRYAAILYDEFAKWEGTDRAAWTAGGDATPCRIPNSTPFGAAGQHFDLVTSDRPKIVMHWSKHPEKAKGLYCVWPKPEEAEQLVDSDHFVGLRSPWYDKECRRRSATEIAQELDIDYIGAGRPVFDGRAGKRIARLIRSVNEPRKLFRFEIEKEEFEELPVGTGFDSYEHILRLYDLPQAGRSYVMACDVAEGKEFGDFSVIKVLCRETDSCAASLYTRWDETILATMFFKIWEMYTVGAERPWWGIETTGLGLTVFDQCVLIHGMTVNAFMMPVVDVVRQTQSFRKGWWTSAKSRNVLVGDLKDWLATASGWVDLRAAREMTVFVRDKNGKARAKEGCNDDEVMCWGIAIQLDLRCPEVKFKQKEKLRPDGLPDRLYDKFEKVDELTTGERCLQQSFAALANTKELEQPSLYDYLP